MYNVFESVAAVIGVIVWLTVVLSVLKIVRKSVKSSQERSGQAPAKPQYRQAAGRPSRSVYKDSVSSGMRKPLSMPSRGAGKLSLGSDGVLMEDRNNDWLAKQIRDEQRVLMRGDMTDLGAVHDRACAADQLKMYHMNECDADGIDNGHYRGRGQH